MAWAGGLGFEEMVYRVFGGCLSEWRILRVAGEA